MKNLIDRLKIDNLLKSEDDINKLRILATEEILKLMIQLNEKDRIIERLQEKNTEMSWTLNPDRMGK